MAAPPGLSIREQLLAHVAATLATITTGNGYAITIGTVTRGHLSPLESFGLPFASVLPVTDDPEYGAGVLRRVLTFTVRLWVDDAPDDAPLTLEALLADVQAALEADVTRGNLAQHTLEQGVQYLYTVSTERLAGADLHWDCHYRSSLTDQRAAP